MKVVVKDFLNVRVGKPSVNAPCYQYLAPGSELEVEDKFYKGDTFEGISNWLKDAANNYYWSGATNVTQPSLATDEFKESDFWWLSQYGIGQLWSKGLSGKGVKVVVLDSGLALPHPDLIVDDKNLRGFGGDGNTIDRGGHGTHVSGMIKATNNGFGVKGIAFNCDFYLGKVRSDSDGGKVEYLVDGLKWAREVIDADIVSVSQGYDEDNAELEKEIGLLARKALVVCAAGNRTSVTGDNILFPARYSETISVGGITQSRTPLTTTINAAQTNVFAPGESILSTTLRGKYAERTGSSQAAPFVAGLSALVLESERRQDTSITGAAIKNKILNGTDTVSFGKIINPLKCL
jgi:subtilisin family serine protease